MSFPARARTALRRLLRARTRRRTAPPAPHAEHGFALLLTIWVLALVAVMATEFAYSMRTEVQIATNYRDEVKAYYLAWAGVQAALYELAQPYTGTILDDEGQVVLVRPGSELPGQGPGYAIEDAVRPAAPPRTHIPLGHGYFSYRLEDEDGKFNVNSLASGGRIRQDNVERFRNLLIATGVEAGETADIIVDSIVDWLDADDLHRLNGAEDEYYEANYEEQGQIAPYHPKNGRFDTLEELLLVRGMTPEIFYGSGNLPPGRIPPDQEESDDWELGEPGGYMGIARYLTVFSFNMHVARINKNTASPFLLNVLFPDQAEEMMQDREETGRTGGRLQASMTFTIIATGQLRGTSVSRTIRAVVQRYNPRRSGGVRIRYWKDNAIYEEPTDDFGFDYSEDGSMMRDLSSR